MQLAVLEQLWKGTHRPKEPHPETIQLQLHLHSSLGVSTQGPDTRWLCSNILVLSAQTSRRQLTHHTHKRLSYVPLKGWKNTLKILIQGCALNSPWQGIHKNTNHRGILLPNQEGKGMTSLFLHCTNFMVQKNFISSYLWIDMGRTQFLTFSANDMGKCSGNVLSFIDCWSSKRITQVGIN